MEVGEHLGRENARECRRPVPSPLRAKKHTIRYKAPGDDRKWISTQGRIGGDTRDMEGPMTGDPPGANSDLGAGQGRKGGGRTDAELDNRSRHTAQGAETSGGGWRVAGVGRSQLDNVPRQERNQGRSTGRRDKRWRLAGGGCGRIPGGRSTTPVEEVENGCYKEKGDARMNATYGGR